MKTKITNDINLQGNLQMLKLDDSTTSDETLIKFKDIITDKFKLQGHMDMVKLLKTEEFIYDKILKLENSSFTINNINSSYHKIKLLMELERDMKINHLQLDVKLSNINMCTIPDNKFHLMKKVFRIKRNKPTTKDELFQLYISMVKHVSTNDFVKANRCMKNNKRETKYTLNEDLVKYHIELNQFSNCFLTNYDEGLLTRLNITKPQKIVHEKKTTSKTNYSAEDLFIDDSDSEDDDLFINSDSEDDESKVSYYSDERISLLDQGICDE